MVLRTQFSWERHERPSQRKRYSWERQDRTNHRCKVSWEHLRMCRRDLYLLLLFKRIYVLIPDQWKNVLIEQIQISLICILPLIHIIIVNLLKTSWFCYSKQFSQIQDHEYSWPVFKGLMETDFNIIALFHFWLCRNF